MITLTYGLKKPETNDTGTALFTALENNLTQMDAHNHDGVTSANLTASSIVGVTQTISSASWVASGATGHYRQSVTLPAGFSFDTVKIGFRTTAGIYICPTVEKITATTYYVYTIDNSINFTAIYGG